jgi:hypothetical protein
MFYSFLINQHAELEIFIVKLKQQSAGGHVISHPDADQPVFAVNIQYPYIVEKYIIYLHEL